MCIILLFKREGMTCQEKSDFQFGSRGKWVTRKNHEQRDYIKKIRRFYEVFDPTKKGLKKNCLFDSILESMFLLQVLFLNVFPPFHLFVLSLSFYVSEPIVNLNYFPSNPSVFLSKLPFSFLPSVHVSLLIFLFTFSFYSAKFSLFLHFSFLFIVFSLSLKNRSQITRCSRQMSPLERSRTRTQTEIIDNDQSQ